MKIAVFAVLFAAVLASAAAQKQLPPPGIPVSDADRKELKTGLDRLAARLADLKDNPHLADVEIYHKAVRYALDGNEFFKPDEVFRAKELLRSGIERADALAHGDAPWLRAAGLIVRAYRSKIDGSVQPYGLVVPASFSPDRPHRWRLDTWFHGRSEVLSEVNFIWDRQRNPGEFTPRDTIVLHLYGRYCNADKFAGEVDLFEALDDVKKTYNIDENRILVRGFSMGGAATWHIAAHHAGDWAAAAPGAGFAETGEYTQGSHKNPPYKPTWWEEKLWRLTDATIYAENFYQLPVVAYNGAIDPQGQAADIMARYMAEEGLHLSRVYAPNTGHKYQPQAKAQINEAIDAIAERGRDPWPRKIRFTTYTLAYNRMRWVVVDALNKHWDRARVEAEIEGDHTVRAKTVNVAALSFEIGPGSRLLDPASKVSVILDGQTISAPGPMTDRSWTARFHRSGSKWELGQVPDAGHPKRHGLQGPIDDAFLDSFLIVRPTGSPMNETVGKWATSEADRAVREWRKQFRGDARVKDDSAITDADIASSNLVLYGDPLSNKVLARIIGQLPLQWTAGSIAIGKQQFPGATHAPVLIYPNPLNPKKYVVINSGFTFRESAYGSNAWQVAELPDYAVVDVTEPNDRWSGKVVQAGFFGEHWEVLPNDGK